MVGLVILFGWSSLYAQINVDRVMLMGRNAMYYEDYVLSIQRFNMVINAKPHLAEPYFYRGLAKFYLEDYAGANQDVSMAISRNPYSENYYVLRGLCRIHLTQYDLAEHDYSKAIDINPLNEDCWHNIVLCQMELNAFQRADSCLNIMLKKWPKKSDNYTLMAQVKMGEKDTVKAEKWVDKALDVNQYDGSALTMKAQMLLQRNKFKDGESYLDRAIVQRPRQADLYLNRALARYNQENLRGAMDDYDATLEINPTSFLGHYNRALLRAQVGDDNRAIEDFNFVIEKEPDNHIAIYNRAILLNNIGDYKGSMRDLTLLINEYPQFWDGYLMRAQIRRKLGDVYGAERDEFKVTKARIEGVKKTKSKKKTRKQDDKDLADYNKLVENDEQEGTTEYASEYRGKVQQRKVALQLMPLYVLSFYEMQSSLTNYTPYIAQVEKMNEERKLGVRLYVSNTDKVSTDETVKMLFDDINYLTDKLDQGTNIATTALMRRAIDYYHVRDFESGLADLDSVIASGPDNMVAYMVRGQMQYAQICVGHPELVQIDKAPLSPSNDVRMVLNNIVQDYGNVIRLDKTHPFGYFNRANIYILLHDYDLAVNDYTKALSIDGTFADAYFNRGIANILQGKKAEGLADLSQAGELGLYSAYSLIKQYSK